MVSFVVALVVIYESDSTLPWWSLIIAVLLAAISILFLGALSAISGVGVSIRESPRFNQRRSSQLRLRIETFVQMIGGYLHPGQPMANMYFVLYSYSKSTSVYLRDMN